MNKTTEGNVYKDDVVLYIANRHNITPEEVVRLFLQTENNNASTVLEDNENEIIKELIRRSTTNNNI